MNFRFTASSRQSDMSLSKFCLKRMAPSGRSEEKFPSSASLGRPLTSATLPGDIKPKCVQRASWRRRGISDGVVTC